MGIYIIFNKSVSIGDSSRTNNIRKHEERRMIFIFAGYTALLAFGIAYKMNLQGDWIFLIVAVFMFTMGLINNKVERRISKQGSKKWNVDI